jgi:hypothetical protein
MRMPTLFSRPAAPTVRGVRCRLRVAAGTDSQDNSKNNTPERRKSETLLSRYSSKAALIAPDKDYGKAAHDPDVPASDDTVRPV